jgi:hypothetical protein
VVLGMLVVQGGVKRMRTTRCSSTALRADDI